MKTVTIVLLIFLSSCRLSYDTRDRYTVECTCDRLIYDDETYLCRICELPIPVKYRHEGDGIRKQRPLRDDL